MRRSGCPMVAAWRAVAGVRDGATQRRGPRAAYRLDRRLRQLRRLALAGPWPALKQGPRALCFRRMKPAPFQYHAPTTIDEALDLLGRICRRRRPGAWPAGRAWCRPWRSGWRDRGIWSTSTASRELNYLEIKDGKLHIGAGVRHAAFEKPVDNGPLGRLLAEGGAATSRIIRSAPAARSAAASPTPIRPPNGARSPPRSTPRWCAESKRSGARVIPAREFFKGIMTTALREDELLTEVRLPILPDDAYAGFAEFSRREGDYAIAMAVVTYRLKSGVMSDMLRIAVGGAEAAPRRIAEAERTLIGRPPNLGTFQAAAHAVVKAVRSARRRQRLRRLSPRHRAHHGDAARCGTPTRRHRRMNDAGAPSKWIGQSVERLEDPPLVTGRGRFAGDINFRAPASHAGGALQPRARQHPVDLHRMRRARCRAWSRCGPRTTSPTCRRSISAKGRSRSSRPTASRCWRQHKVRYVGEPIAAVFAEDPYVAEDAADLVTMEVEELPPLLDAARRARRVLVRPRHRGDGSDAGLWRRRGGVQVRARTSSS